MNDKFPSDKDLIEQYLSGDKTTLAILVKRWHKIFCEKAYWVLRDKNMSKDVAQECWIIIINKLDTLENKDRFKNWALRIIYTQAINVYKQQIRERKNLSGIDHEVNQETHEEEINHVLKSTLLKAIKELPKEKQDIIRLFYVEEYSIKEISIFLNIPKGTVKSRLFKAREKLKVKLKASI